MAASSLLLRFAEKLFPDAGKREAFIEALQQPQEFPPALVWTKERPPAMPFAAAPRLAWQSAFVDRVLPGQNCGAHQLHREGHYYCLDFSSVFEVSVTAAVSEPVRTVLDVCSAPGGKAIFSSCLLTPALLVCNEVIGKRTAHLIANLKRCATPHAVVISRDPSILAQLMGNAADLVLVDAPCSGQSLLAKGQKAPGCFHPKTINMNARRQRRIIANAARTVAPGAWLAYTTCTYSRDENEAIIAWFLKKCPSFEAVASPALSEYLSPYAAFPCYRMWPQGGIGAGGFGVLLRKTSSGTRGEVSLEEFRLLYQA